MNDDESGHRTFTKKDFKVDWFSGTGAGGQHRNKHQNCVRITHKDTGLSVTGQSFKERRRNFDCAFTRLAHMLKEHYYPKNQRDREPATETIRTYNFEDNRITDHMSGHKMPIKKFENGEVIDEAIRQRYNGYIEEDDQRG